MVRGRARRAALALLFALVLLPPAPTAAGEGDFPFAPWSDATFARARQERRILLVMVSTSWCHWCHVMKRETFGDAVVRAELARAFLPIYVDADARPDLAERFRNYRWPALAFLTSQAKPILALRGYRSPTAFLSVLRDVQRRVRRGGPYPGFKNPNTERPAARSSDDTALRALALRLRRELDSHWDPVAAGWGNRQKYPVPEPVEYGLLAKRLNWPGADQAYARALRTLGEMEPLIDRAWGGVYQYSVGSTWRKWHPEKIMSVNAGAFLNYAEAYALTKNARWRRNADAVELWFRKFMTRDAGGFYASQDADAERLMGERFYRLPRAERESGRYGALPKVDRSIYARENGWAIHAFARAAAWSTGLDERSRLWTHARRAVEHVLGKLRNADGTLRHAADDTRRVYLGDQTAFGRGLLAAHAPVGRPAWLKAAKEIAGGMRARLSAPTGGFYDVSASKDPGVFATRTLSLEANADAARFLLELAAWTKSAELRAEARKTIAAVSDERRIRGHWRHVAGLLIAVELALRPYAHIEVRGRDDEAGRALWAAARERMRLRYPQVVATRLPSEEAPFAVVCGETSCSEPLRDADALRASVATFTRPPALGSPR